MRVEKRESNENLDETSVCDWSNPHKLSSTLIPVRPGLSKYLRVLLCSQVKAFYEGRDAGSGSDAVKQAIERIQTNIDWVERSAGTIAEYLNNKV
jgi:hypothetical protein